MKQYLSEFIFKRWDTFFPSAIKVLLNFFEDVLNILIPLSVAIRISVSYILIMEFILLDKSEDERFLKYRLIFSWDLLKK